MDGEWSSGTVRGILFNEGWGAAIGYPGLKLDPDGPPVDVQIFESAELTAHWQRLDGFEGAEYCRVTTRVMTAGGAVDAQIYVIAE